ncbi:serine/threonine-protein kinase [Pseudomonas zhanjiangensis]|uniref:Protein kinase n=1 Tax=Pseudomonas zhanjiangensis TaxID=3239015 RepID=A0ABV3YZZ2_9PSED
MNEQLIEIPGYHVHARLGQGGMAEVYLATQLSLQRKVALKVLRQVDDQAFSERFVQEGHMVASLHHRSIITIHDIGRLADGRDYLAMEFVAGGDLSRHKGELFEPQQALRIIRQIASALAVVHDHGLVHRDIKPANILFREDGTALLTDFGVAKQVTLDHDLTHSGIAVGSPAYSSPEQAQCLTLDARSDIYSLGVILLELLSGANPYRGASYTQTVMNHVQMPVPQLSAPLQDYQWLLERMLAKDPDERFADCKVLLASLDELQPEPDAGDPRAHSVPAAAGGSWRPRLAWGLLAVLLLGGAGAAGYFGYRQVQIADFLARAEQRLDAGQLLEPPQDNADYLFRQALALDADNGKALDGLQRVLQARIVGYLDLAEQRLADDRLLMPEDDSATFYFRQVLGWQPDNLLALAGLNRVAQRFIEGSEQAYARRQFDLALESIKQGLEVEPDNETLLQLYDRHPQRVAAARPLRAPAATRSAEAAKPQQARQNPIKRLWNKLFNN